MFCQTEVGRAGNACAGCGDIVWTPTRGIGGRRRARLATRDDHLDRGHSTCKRGRWRRSRSGERHLTAVDRLAKMRLLTLATRGTPKAVLKAALCGVPLAAEIVKATRFKTRRCRPRY
jgi:hypothetical protein